MTSNVIHFAHANGFPARTYNKLFSYLTGDYEIGYLERHAHNPVFPVTDNWFRLKDELREEIRKCYDEPVIGVGHSLGGVLHLLVAAENPELYRQIVLLDAPIISRLSSRGLQILKMTKLIDRYSPAQMTRFRRNSWETKNEAYEHFEKKPKFAAFDAEVLRDYVEHGLIETGKGFQLFFKPSIEAAIYRTLPHHLPSLRGRLQTSIAYIGGTESREARLAGLAFMRKHFSIEFQFINGSHLFPLEKPRETAEKLIEIIKNNQEINRETHEKREKEN
jgi:pimeloyl-ACP methyl ester carboxylesterase